MVHCCVPLCANSSKKKAEISFHRFPQEKQRQKKWIANIRRDPGPDFKLTGNSVVCSAHFKMDDFVHTGYTSRNRLTSEAVPTVFVWSKTTKKRSGPSLREPLLSKRKGLMSIENMPDDDGDLSIQQPESSPASQSPLNTLPCPSKDHDYDVKPQDIRSLLDSANNEIDRLRSELSILQKEHCFYSRMSKDPDLVEFYTGFPDYTLLMTFYQAVEPTATKMTRYSQYQRAQRKDSLVSRVCFPQQSLSLVDQYILVLRKLRVGNFDKELADQYNVSESTISRIFISWINFLYFILGSLPLWPSREQIQDHMPDIFRDEYPQTRVVLDCTEMWVQRPSSLALNTEFYSHYKGHTTMKALIGIAPSGAVSFVSKLFPGSISDKAITRCSGILELIQPGDEIMVDKGFIIEDLLFKIGAKLVIPPFLTGTRPQFEPEEVTETQSIARLRVHVERAIRRVKCYHIFDRVIPLTLAGSLNQIWSVCTLMTNFKGDLF